MSLLLLLSLALMTASFLFTRLQHPLAMGLALVSQTLLVCLASGMMSSFMWLSYILFLIFLGATLVLFAYVASLASNEVFKLSYSLGVTVLSPLLAAPALLLKDELLQPIKTASEDSSLTPTELLHDPTFSLSLIYNLPSSLLTSFIILYLLLTLIVVVKLTSSTSGPLRLS